MLSDSVQLSDNPEKYMQKNALGKNSGSIFCVHFYLE